MIGSLTSWIAGRFAPVPDAGKRLASPSPRNSPCNCPVPGDDAGLDSCQEPPRKRSHPFPCICVPAPNEMVIGPIKGVSLVVPMVSICALILVYVMLDV